MSRLREGRANTARGAGHFLRETVGRVRHASISRRALIGQLHGAPPASGQRLGDGRLVGLDPTAASTLIAWYPSAARWMSASPSPSGSTKASAQCHRGRIPMKMPGLPFPTGWTAPPMWPRPPTLPSRASPTPVPVRLIVRRVNAGARGQLTVRADSGFTLIAW